MEESINTDPQMKESRKRKKKLITEVQELLEFYFSPSNLNKDLFMQSLLDMDEYIDLEVFHKFNKVKKLTSETKILAKAVKLSVKLKLSEDGLKVKLSQPLKMKDNEMECTIYVENLPHNSSHDWLKKVFTPYGTIDYISLPHFHQSGRPKGFAFIEFSTPEEAQKALEAFGGGLASLDGTLNPAELLSIKTYQQENVEPPKETLASTEHCPEPKKRTHSDAFLKENDEELPVSKQPKEDKSEAKGISKKKKKRKRNKKDKDYEVDQVYLKVMSKREWKSLRNRYLNLQRQNMKTLKCSFPNYSQVQPKKSTKPEFMPGVLVKIQLKSPPHDAKDFRLGLMNGRSSIAYIDIGENSPVVVIRFKYPEGAKEFLEENLFPDCQLIIGQKENDYWDGLEDSWQRKRPNKQKKKEKDSEYLATFGERDHPPTFRGRDKLVNKALKMKDIEPTNTRIVFDD